MVRLRLWRVGAPKKPEYRIVAIDPRKKMKGEYSEWIGSINPRTKKVSFKEDAVLRLLSQGAQPSETVRTMLKTSGIYKKFLDTKKVIKNK